MSALRTCFIPEKGESEIREYFEKRRGGVLKPMDDIRSIERRYAPLGVFEIKRKEDIKTGIISRVKKTIERSNKFYINLNNANLYYVSKGRLGKKPRIEKLDVMERIIDLPSISIEFLSDIVKKGRITHHELNKKHFLFLNGNFDCIMMLKTRDLIDFHPRVYGANYEIYAPHLEYLAKINILDFGDKRYNLGDFLSTEQIKLEGKKVDELIYNSEDILDRLEIFFAGDGISQSIVYLPYDECMYVDKEGRFRHDRLIAPKFSI